MAPAPGHGLRASYWLSHFSGEIDVDGHTHVLDRVPGVVEDCEIL